MKTFAREYVARGSTWARATSQRAPGGAIVADMSILHHAVQKIPGATEAELYGVSLGLMRFATPAEIGWLAGNPSVPNGRFRDWLIQLDWNIRLHRRDRAAYQHRRLADGVSLFSAGGDAAGKTLMIGVCGQTHMLCSPTAVLLQYFPEDTHDVVVLRDKARRSYTTGSLGYADTFPTLIERLRVDLNVKGYRDLKCFGVSSGGAAALALGLVLAASANVSLCGRPATVSASYGGSPEAVAFDRFIRDAPKRADVTFAVHGADNETDSRNARGLADLTPLQLMPVAGLADHNLVTPLHARGDLDGLFRTVGLL